MKHNVSGYSFSEVLERCENLPDEALKYYKVATKKQLKSRLSVKLGKLQQTPLSSIAN
jgi:hypothetical protein